MQVKWLVYILNLCFQIACSANKIDYYNEINLPKMDKENTDIDYFITAMFHSVLVLQIP